MTKRRSGASILVILLLIFKYKCFNQQIASLIDIFYSYLVNLPFLNKTFSLFRRNMMDGITLFNWQTETETPTNSQTFYMNTNLHANLFHDNTFVR